MVTLIRKVVLHDSVHQRVYKFHLHPTSSAILVAILNFSKVLRNWTCYTTNMSYRPYEGTKPPRKNFYSWCRVQPKWPFLPDVIEILNIINKIHDFSKLYSIYHHNNSGNNSNNNGPNGHFFYVGGDLVMRRGMLPIIMLPDGDLRIALHLFWILTIWGSVHIE